MEVEVSGAYGSDLLFQCLSQVKKWVSLYLPAKLFNYKTDEAPLCLAQAALATVASKLFLCLTASPLMELTCSRDLPKECSARTKPPQIRTNSDQKVTNCPEFQFTN